MLYPVIKVYSYEAPNLYFLCVCVAVCEGGRTASGAAHRGFETESITLSEPTK